MRRELDLFGVLLLAIAAAVSGGVGRDVLIGAVPPGALSAWRYLATALITGAITFWWYPLLDRLKNPVQLFDAAGLALFAVAGTQKALAHGLSPGMAVLLGMLTGVGGGMVRDILLAQVPSVLRSDLYAVAALLGGSVVVLGAAMDLHPALSASLGAASCFALRVAAIRYRLQLPIARPPRTAEEGDERD